MYLSIFYLVACAILVMVLQLTECTPIAFFWNKAIEGGHCRSPDEVRAAIVGTSVVFVFSDFQFSLLPLTFVFKLNRPLKERILVAGIMSLGLLASTIGCLKFIGLDRVRTSPDPTWAYVTWKVASAAEASIGITAANIPPLKARGEKLIRSISSGGSVGSWFTSSFSLKTHAGTLTEANPTRNSVTSGNENRAGSNGTLESAKTPFSMVNEEGGPMRIEEV
jgi:hypothetical protein